MVDVLKMAKLFIRGLVYLLLLHRAAAQLRKGPIVSVQDKIYLLLCTLHSFCLRCC